MDSCDIPSFPDALRKIAKAKRIPLCAQLELTARCNFNCRMCYIHMDDKRIKELGKELTTDEWLRICREAKDAGTLYLTLTGGEIFTRPDFQELYTKLTEMGFLISLMTNASLIDEKVMSWLGKLPPYMIRITLYGSNNDVYNSVCRVGQGFERVDKALDLLQQANIPISLKAVLIKNNAPDIRNMYNYSFKRGLQLSVTEGINKSVRGAVSEADIVRIKPYEEELKQLGVGRYYHSTNTHGPFRHHSYYLDDCGPYGYTFQVTWDGNMTMCSFMSEPAVNLRENSVSKAWLQLMDITSHIKKPEKCNTCKYEEYCVRCPGGLAAECGSYNIVTDSYCEAAHRLYQLYTPKKEGKNNEKNV